MAGARPRRSSGAPPHAAPGLRCPCPAHREHLCRGGPVAPAIGAQPAGGADRRRAAQPRLRYPPGPPQPAACDAGARPADGRRTPAAGSAAEVGRRGLGALRAAHLGSAAGPRRSGHARRWRRPAPGSRRPRGARADQVGGAGRPLPPARPSWRGGADRDCRRAPHRRRAGRAWLPGPPPADRRAVRARSLCRAGGAAV